MMRHLIATFFITVTSLYVLEADEKSKSLVVIEYSNNTKDIVVIPRKFEYNSDYIFKAINPILTKRGI